MIRKLSQLSEALAEERRNSPDGIRRMHEASCGQSPDLLLISSIKRGMQDIQLLRLKQGEAFFATRITGFPILESDHSTILAASPAAYNCKFPLNRGIVVTFEIDEPDEILSQSVDTISSFPGSERIPIAALRVDYESGQALAFNHRKTRDVGLENSLTLRLSTPAPLDDSLLVILCSDSRLQPPRTPKGAPMVIRTLGGYIPPFSDCDDETRQMNHFLSNWLSSQPFSKRILVTAHGSFQGEGPSCGAGTASLSPVVSPSNALDIAIAQLSEAAREFEVTPADTPESRVLSIAQATKRNLFRYPAL